METDVKESGMILPPVAVFTLVDLLRWRALHQADREAYTFLIDGEKKEVSLTYGELDHQAQVMAAQLQSLGATEGRALLLYPPGLEYITAFFGCLYAGMTAVPIYPPRLNRPDLRLQAVVADAQAKVALTTAHVLANIERRFVHTPALKALHWLATDNVAPELAEEWQNPEVSRDSPAFFQYTSGSTAAPKGVILTHSNLLHNSSLIHRCFEHTPESRGVIWLPPYHDMGLIGGILQPLYGGFPVTLMSPLDFLRRPFRWLQAISRYKATTSGGPNFAYDLCVQKVTPDQLETLDLSHWKVAFNGAEPIRPETLDRFVQTFESCGFRREAFYPCYGLAEGTLIVSGGDKAAPPAARSFQRIALEQNRAVEASSMDDDTRTLVSCGRTLPDQHIVVVNPDTLTECSSGQVGEIWVSGPSVAQGYWNQPEKTSNTFRAYLAETQAGPFLRTGDLGFWQNDELFITGRLKDLIIIRGRNYYPQDIEQAVEQSHPALRPGCGAAFSVDVDDRERLVVVQELDTRRSVEIENVVNAIRQAVFDQHKVQVHTILLLAPRTIPKTSSGKIQRHACKAKFLAESLKVVKASILDDNVSFKQTGSNLTRDRLLVESLLAIAPEQRQRLLEGQLQQQVAQILKVKPDQLDPQHPLTAFGLDSLSAVELQYTLQTHLGVDLPMATFLQKTTLAQLVAEIVAHLTTPTSTPETNLTPSQNSLTEYPLSFGQRGLAFLHQLAPHNTAYHIARAVRVRSQVDIPALQRAFQHLLNRHPALRTTFIISDEQMRQRIQPQMTVHFEVQQAASWTESALKERLIETAQLPFDLTQGPLLRVHLFKRSEQETVLLLVVHHIVVDFWSLTILVQELSRLYQAESSGSPTDLPPLNLHYTDYVRWQADTLAGPEGERLWAYWRQQLGGELPVLNLPTDKPRPLVQSFRGASHSFRLSKTLSQQLKALAKTEGVTFYTTLLAAFQVLLYRYTGQEDILVGSPTAGRSRAELADVVGYFVNPLVLRANLTGNPTFKSFLERTQQTVLAAFAHQEYPFALLVEQLQPERELSRSPLFQVMFALQKAPRRNDEGLSGLALPETEAEVTLEGLRIESIALPQQTAQFDLSLMMAEVEGKLLASLQYNRDLFETATMARLAEHVQTLLAGIAANPQTPIAALPLLTQKERQQVLFTWNDTQVSYPQTQCLHQLIEAQAARTPEAVAVVYDDQQLTYQDLNERANQLAHYLQQCGVRPEVLVGLCLERSLEMVVGLLGILKAGGAYVPLDPTYPPARLASMLEDSQTPVLLSQRHLVEQLPPYEGWVISLDADWETIARESCQNPISEVSADNLAYAIYTSGSTGKPKGAMNTHRGICNRLLWMQEEYQLTDTDRVLQKTPFTFDVSVWEFFWPLLAGARLVVAQPEGHKDRAYLAKLINEQEITTLHFVPSMLRIFLEEPGIERCNSIRQVICSGEALPFDLQERFFTRLNTELHNLYGPTEAAIDVTYWACQPENGRRIVPIGRPIANIQIYILDSRMQPVPIGVPGELHIGGVGLARGYLNRPELTAEKFIPNPFTPPYSPHTCVRGKGAAGARLYKTGDLARYLPDGNIEFLNRLDHQIKIRGFRIELGEIEAVLAQHPAVRETVVIDREDMSGEKRLVAYVVLNQELISPTSQLRRFLGEKLPDYMVPSTLVFLDTLPLTPNGKLNRRALPAPELLRPELEVDYVPPRTEIERTIAAIWQTTLHLERVGIHDNFFDLGGHSSLMAQVHHKLHQRLQKELSMLELFKYPTIASLAEYLSRENGESVLFEGSEAQIEQLKAGKKRLAQRLRQRQRVTEKNEEPQIAAIIR